MRSVIMHIADLHAGPPFNLEIGEQLALQAHEIKPDLLVVSGDLVQRADFLYQWRTIVAYLKTLPQPQLIVPGNHDVPLFNLFYRFFFPLKYYQKAISPNVNPLFTRPGLAVVGGCTAYGMTLDGGWLSREQQTILEQQFAGFEDTVCKVAVLHHPVIKPPKSNSRTRVVNAGAVLRLLDRCKIDLLLCGHGHFSMIQTVNGFTDDLRPSTILSMAGTATSRRGRGYDHRQNSFHLVTIDEEAICIQPFFYNSQAKRFLLVAEYRFLRKPTNYSMNSKQQIYEELASAS